MNFFYSSVLTLTLLISSQTSVASPEVLKESETGNHYLNKYGLTVYVDSQNEALENITLKTALTDQGTIYYSKSKNVFFNGDMPMIDNKGQLDLLDRELIDYVISNMPGVIEKRAPNEKLVVTLFTDFTCGWCQKVHSNIESYTDAGITIRFALFPRNGLKDQTANMMSSIVNSETPYDLMQRVFEEQYIASSPLSPVIKNNYQVAQSIGLTSTPTFVVNGYPFAGYLTAEQLLRTFTDSEG